VFRLFTVTTQAEQAGREGRRRGTGNHQVTFGYPESYSNSEIDVAEPCFRKEDTNPPTCGVHNVLLLKKQLPTEMVGAGYKGFTYLVFPVTGTVLNDPAKQS
jgi:hypothetical protein